MSRSSMLCHGGESPIPGHEWFSEAGVEGILFRSIMW